jgi:hypothetical protein
LRLLQIEAGEFHQFQPAAQDIRWRRYAHFLQLGIREPGEGLPGGKLVLQLLLRVSQQPIERDAFAGAGEVVVIEQVGFGAQAVSVRLPGPAGGHCLQSLKRLAGTIPCEVQTRLRDIIMLSLCFGQAAGVDAGKDVPGAFIITATNQPIGAGQQVILFERCGSLFCGLQVERRSTLEIARCLPCLRLGLETLVSGGRHYAHAGAAATDQGQAGDGEEHQDGSQAGWMHCGRLSGQIDGSSSG